jgi:hypothetical protein
MILVCEHIQNSFDMSVYGLFKNTTGDVTIHVLYYSKFFEAGFFIEVADNFYNIKPIEKINFSSETIKSEIERLYNTFYDETKKNILYYGGGGPSVHPNTFENIHGLDLFILDVSYSSRTDILTSLVGKTNFFIGCSTMSHNAGFLTNALLHSSGVDDYKKIIDAFVKTNLESRLRTDASLIDMGKYSRIVRYLDTVDRNPEYKIDRTLNYYDLMNLVTDRNLKYKIKNCILYFNMNNSSKKYFFNKNIKISGIIV